MFTIAVRSRLRSLACAAAVFAIVAALQRPDKLHRCRAHVHTTPVSVVDRHGAPLAGVHVYVQAWDSRLLDELVTDDRGEATAWITHPAFLSVALAFAETPPVVLTYADVRPGESRRFAVPFPDVDPLPGIGFSSHGRRYGYVRAGHALVDMDPTLDTVIVEDSRIDAGPVERGTYAWMPPTALRRTAIAPVATIAGDPVLDDDRVTWIERSDGVPSDLAAAMLTDRDHSVTWWIVGDSDGGLRLPELPAAIARPFTELRILTTFAAPREVEQVFFDRFRDTLSITGTRGTVAYEAWHAVDKREIVAGWCIAHAR
jgi:hypothetical protein